MQKPELNTLSKIVITNEDYAFNAFIKYLFEKDQFSTLVEGPRTMRFKKAQPKPTLGNKIMPVELEFFPGEGLYHSLW